MASNIELAAQMLDEEIPGWYHLVNVETLQMANCQLCVLGQLFGNEEKIRKIVKQPELLPVKIDSYSIGTRYLRAVGRFTKYSGTEDAFGYNGRCEWINEILKRREVDEQT